VDARAALAVAMTEGGTKFGAVGDKGTSFGPFQLHIGGQNPYGDPAKAAAFANSIQGINYALDQMAKSGARGLTGLAAIKQIVGGPGWGFERPKNAAAEVAKAFEYFKQIPKGAVAAITAGGKALTAAQRAQLQGIVALVKQYAPIIGLEHVKGILAGLAQGQPTFVQRAKQAIVDFIAAQKQALADARAGVASAFASMAQQALAAFDQKWAGWVPPAQKLLDKMQLQDQVKQAQAALASAMAQVTAGGAAVAQDLGKGLASAIGDAMSQAFGEIAGAKTEAALNKIANQAQRQITAAITQATAQATQQAQAAVDQASAQLVTAQAGGDPEAIAKAQQALDTAVQNQKGLDDAIRTQIEFDTQQLIAAEQARHDQIGAKQRELFAQQLLNIQANLAKHPGAYKKASDDVLAVLAKYNIPMFKAGQKLASQFGDGLDQGIGAVITAAKKLAAALQGVQDSLGGGGGGGGNTNTPGRAAGGRVKAGMVYWVGEQGKELFIPSMSGRIVPNNQLGSSSMAAFAGGPTINVYVSGSVTTENQLVDTIHAGLLRKNGRNAGLGFT
jgi:hypothetical protein